LRRVGRARRARRADGARGAGRARRPRARAAAAANAAPVMYDTKSGSERVKYVKVDAARHVCITGPNSMTRLVHKTAMELGELDLTSGEAALNLKMCALTPDK
jgi:hypothetical protein